MTASLSKVPTELRKILLDFTLSCLLEKPQDYVEHGLRYFERLRECRENERKISRNEGGSESSQVDENEKELRRQMMKALANRRKTVAAERYNPEDDESLKSIVIPKSDEERKKLAEDVKGVFILRVLEREEMTKVMDAMYSKFAEKDEVIIRQGDTIAENFFIIAEGVYEALVSFDSKEPEVVKTYNNSGSFGELALMYNVPRAATIRAVTDGRLWVLDRETFRKIVLKSAYLKRERYQALIEKVAFLKELNSYAKLDLADSLVSKYFSDGETIFNQGDDADGMYFIEIGSVCLILNHPVQGEVIVSELFPGDYLGELALITHNRRALTAVAEGEVKLAFLDKDTFERLLGPCTEVLTKHFMDYENKMVEAVGSATSVYFQNKDE